MITYQLTFKTLINYPLIGGLWWNPGGGHSALGEAFARYGLFGGIVFCKILYSVPIKYKKMYNYKGIQQLANANLVVLLYVTLLDSMPYSFLGMVLIVTPILYENIIGWDGLTANNKEKIKIENEEDKNVPVTLPKTT